MKRFFKVFGYIFLILVSYSIFFWNFADKSIPIYNDMGVLEALIMLIALSIAEFHGLIFSLIIFLILFNLRKFKKISMDDNVLFILGYSVLVIINTFLYLFLMSKGLQDFSLDTITVILFIPFIHTIIFFNLIGSLIDRYKKKK